VAKATLDGRWQLREVSTKPRLKGAIPAMVPGGVHTALLAAGAIADPYVGRNELECLWVDQADWQYRRTFSATARQCAAAMQELVFEGLDTAAEVRLNGRLVGRADNMFRRWRFDVRGVLRPGDNCIEVLFRSPIRHGEAQSRRSKSACRPLDYGFGASGVRRMVWRPFVRKAQYQYGWDWGPCLAASGIWQTCHLLTADEPVFEYVTTQQRHRRGGTVELEVTAHVLAPRAGRGLLRVSLGGRTAETPAALKPGSNRVTAVLSIDRPRLWWPAGEGEPALYRLRAEWVSEAPRGPAALPGMVWLGGGTGKGMLAGLGRGARGLAAGDPYECDIGFRTVELVRRKDAAGEGFKFRVNGRDVYCKGANWVPDDVFPERTTAERLEFLIDSALAANMNMLRVWGGGIYPTDALLALCDRKGLMVWQDFMFACAAYPEDRDFLESVEAEMRHQMRRMMNHPSIVLWCGNNENQTAVDSWWASLPERKRFRRAYDKLTYGVQERVVAQEDPGRPWWPSSPSGCPRRPGYPFGDERAGDMHNWAVWHGRKDFKNYLAERPRFSSEFGFQSFPDIETLRTVARPGDLNVSSPAMEQHQRHPAGNSIITDFLTREFRFPTDFGDFCYLSQVNQGLAMKLAIEHWRRLKPHCMGTLYWQINDVWPVASWSSIDWHLRWKALHYMARRFYAPLLGSVSDDERGLRLWATSDVAEPLVGQWRVEAWTFSGRQVWEARGRFRLKAGESHAIAKLPKSRILDAGRRSGDSAAGEERVFLVTEVRSGLLRSRNTHLFVPIKRAELPRANIRYVVRRVENGYEVRLRADAPMFHVEHSTGKLRGVFSDNILTLLPGRTATVRWTPSAATTLAAFRKSLRVRSVRDTYWRDQHGRAVTTRQDAAAAVCPPIEAARR